MARDLGWVEYWTDDFLENIFVLPLAAPATEG